MPVYNDIDLDKIVPHKGTKIACACGGQFACIYKRHIMAHRESANHKFFMKHGFQKKLLSTERPDINEKIKEIRKQQHIELDQKIEELLRYPPRD